MGIFIVSLEVMTHGFITGCAVDKGHFHKWQDNNLTKQKFRR